jgi:hypothetical protein
VIVLLNLTSQNALIGDFDNDNDIDRNDINQFSSMLRQGAVENMSYDFNNDEQVNSLDVRALMSMCTRYRCAVE